MAYDDLENTRKNVKEESGPDTMNGFDELFSPACCIYCTTRWVRQQT